MGIHHATLKRASNAGIVLTETEDGEVEAHWPEGNRRITNGNAKHVLAAMLLEKRFFADYPKLRVNVEEDVCVVFHDDDRDKALVEFDPNDYNEDDVYAEALEAAQEAELDLDGEEAEDDERTGSVVKPIYKQIYKERGNPANCGDWFAKLLEFWTHSSVDGKKAKPNIERFFTLAEANGVDTGVGAFVNRSPGWQGRARMTGRRLMLKAIREAGYMVIPDVLTGDAEVHVTPPENCEWPTH